MKVKLPQENDIGVFAPTKSFSLFVAVRYIGMTWGTCGFGSTHEQALHNLTEQEDRTTVKVQEFDVGRQIAEIYGKQIIDRGKK